MKTVKSIFSALSEIAFPEVCICCGFPPVPTGSILCTWCREERFEQSEYPSEEMVPNSVASLFALWNFDKGGYLQELMHQLKYHHMERLGRELGVQMALEMPSAFRELAENGGAAPLLIPVPIHRSKLRKRGYNQSRVIAEGIASVTGWEIIEDEFLIRIRNTGSQTGLSREQREANVRNSFQIPESARLHNRRGVIVDDVFTTGATVFELAESVHLHSGKRVMVTAVARA